MPSLLCCFQQISSKNKCRFVGTIYLQSDRTNSTQQHQTNPANARSYDKETKLSKEQTQRKAKLESESYEAWQKARTAKDFSLFAPKLGEVIELAKEIAATVDPEKDAYTSAMDQFEKGMTAARIDEVRCSPRRFDVADQ